MSRTGGNQRRSDSINNGAPEQPGLQSGGGATRFRYRITLYYCYVIIELYRGALARIAYAARRRI